MSANENQIVVYQPNETVRLDVRLENETVWLTQAQLCDLFGVVKSNVSYHLKNIFGTHELDYGATVQKIRTVRTEAGRTVSRDIEYFNLDVIISLGYRINSRLGIQFQQWATRVLKEYLLHGQVVNQRLAQFEDKVDRRLAKHDDRIAMLEEKVDFFVQTKEPPLQSIFYQNRFWDAKSLLIKFIRRAKKELIVIDAYPGVATLDMLAKRGRGVKIELVTHSNGELEESDFEAFGTQCGKFTKTICGICHDRFIIVDQEEIFWTGASLKDAGRLTFAAAKMGAEVIPGLLDSIRKAEVFTPSRIYNAMNNLTDAAWFNRKTCPFMVEGNKSWQETKTPVTFSKKLKKTWLDFVTKVRLEITCGEAPFLASRYDTTTGAAIPISECIGLYSKSRRDENATVEGCAESGSSYREDYANIHVSNRR